MLTLPSFQDLCQQLRSPEKETEDRADGRPYLELSVGTQGAEVGEDTKIRGLQIMSWKLEPLHTPVREKLS